MEKVQHQQRLQQLVQNAGNKIIVVIFMDKNCPHCKRAMPDMEKLAMEINFVIFVRIDVRETPVFVNDYDIRAVPLFVFIKAGAVRDRIPGADKSTIEKRIQDLTNE